MWLDSRARPSRRQADAKTKAHAFSTIGVATTTPPLARHKPPHLTPPLARHTTPLRQEAEDAEEADHTTSPAHNITTPARPARPPPHLAPPLARHTPPRQLGHHPTSHHHLVAPRCCGVITAPPLTASSIGLGFVDVGVGVHRVGVVEIF
ncbi:MAG: hypothetical protein K8963_07695 [Proteobacteria bacterium]|nr:hypothetical protein [Pseudomonadota bacterium]